VPSPLPLQGVQLIRDKESAGLRIAPHYVFIAPPSMAALEERLRGRGTETEEAVLLRISNASAEVGVL
jgi:guanylate kinase